jgi:hypothetical protein
LSANRQFFILPLFVEENCDFVEMKTKMENPASFVLLMAAVALIPFVLLAILFYIYCYRHKNVSLFEFCVINLGIALCF